MSTTVKTLEVNVGTSGLTNLLQIMADRGNVEKATSIQLLGFGLYDDPSPIDLDYNKYRSFDNLIGWCDITKDNSDGSHPLNGNRVLASFDSQRLPDGSYKVKVVGEFGTQTAIGKINKIRVFGQPSTTARYPVANSKSGITPDVLNYLSLDTSFIPRYGDTNCSIMDMEDGKGVPTGRYEHEAAYIGSFCAVLGDNSAICPNGFQSGAFYAVKKAVRLKTKTGDTGINLMPRLGKDIDALVPFVSTLSNTMTEAIAHRMRVLGDTTTGNIYQFGFTSGNALVELVIYDESKDYAPTTLSITLPSVPKHAASCCATAKPDGTFDLAWADVDNISWIQVANYNPTTQVLGSVSSYPMGIDYIDSTSTFWEAFWIDPVTNFKYLFTHCTYWSSSGYDSSNFIVVHGMFPIEQALIETEVPFYAGQAGSFNATDSYPTRQTGRSSSGRFNKVSLDAGSAGVYSWNTCRTLADGSIEVIGSDVGGNNTYTTLFKPQPPYSVIAEAQVLEIEKTASDQLQAIIEITVKVD